MLGNGALIISIAGKSKTGIRKGKNIAAMACAVAIKHVGLDAHSHAGLAGFNFKQLHAQVLGGKIVLPHGVSAVLGQGGGKGVIGHVYFPLKAAGRFSRKALTPSA